MALYAIGDLHLSLSVNKPMDVFGENWNEHTERLAEGFSRLTDEDVTVLCGDLSWGISLEEAKEDFLWIDRLPGRKIILKGNHDYWWTTVSKMNSFFQENGISTIDILHNNCFLYGQTAICGTRGWFFEEDFEGSHNEKIFRRELIRLESSFRAAEGHAIFCFLHYPPCYQRYVCSEIIDLLHKYGVSKCFYGHLHGRQSHRMAVTGQQEGMDLQLISADYLNFEPRKILE